MEDMIANMGASALASRLKRISDSLIHSSRMMYKTIDLEIEPNWFLVLSLIKSGKEYSVMDLATQLKFTHQSVLVITQKMIKKGFITKHLDENDRRRFTLSLTEKGESSIPKLQQIWSIGEQAMLEMLNHDLEILKHLKVLEQNMEINSFGNRILEKLSLDEK